MYACYKSLLNDKLRGALFGSSWKHHLLPCSQPILSGFGSQGTFSSLEGDTNIQEGTLFQDSPVVSNLKTRIHQHSLGKFSASSFSAMTDASFALRIFFSAEHLAGLCLHGSNAVWPDVLKGCNCFTLNIKKHLCRKLVSLHCIQTSLHCLSML